MFEFLRNPGWIHPLLFTENSIGNIPSSLFTEIKEGLSRFRSPEPVVSVVIPVLNEEFTILRTLHSLSRNKTKYPAEIIVINNNSTDHTQEVLDKLNVINYFQAIPGWGPARQMGLEKARGKYILSADADSFYPEEWIERMTTALAKDNNTSCVYGDYSYLGTDEYPRWEFLMYEAMRSVIRTLRHIKRPHFNARGI
ncbi:MAG TPA: glycosyltransferase family 2 protein, partial [Chryseosolibacter sp.]